MQKKMDLLAFRKAIMDSNGNAVVEQLKGVFGDEKYRYALTYLGELGTVLRLEYRIKLLISFFFGMATAVTLGFIVKVFS